MNVIDRLSHLAHNTRCVVCGHSTLDMRLRCDLDSGPCLATARCERCSTTFLIDQEETAGELTLCPHCGRESNLWHLSCDAESHACTEMRVCPRCHRRD